VKSQASVLFHQVPVDRSFSMGEELVFSCPRMGEEPRLSRLLFFSTRSPVDRSFSMGEELVFFWPGMGEELVFPWVKSLYLLPVIEPVFNRSSRFCPELWKTGRADVRKSL
jgi:hypothetical protein